MLTLCAAAVVPRLVAQAPSVSFVDVGSERERYLRLMQISGAANAYPWTIRSLSPREADALLAGKPGLVWPLADEPTTNSLGWLRWQVLPLQTRNYYNSAFPYGFNDGPVWAGRGVTSSLSGGVAARLGPISLQFEPMVFDAQNQSFPLAATGRSGLGVYGNEFYPSSIDLPQRFGNGAYHRFDMGQSTIRIDAGPVAAAFSTANQFWGPALENPLILGNNAAGFPHVYVGTAHPWNIYVGTVHGRVVWGRLDQSPYSPYDAGDTRRFMAAAVGVFTPRGIPGLELGAARFFHNAWPAGGLRDAPFLRPFEGILKSSLSTPNDPSGNSPDNQLASIFARWALPGSGAEVYAEYGREDHNQDLRDLWEEPDHDSGYLIGLQRVWPAANGPFVLRGEVLNTRVTHLSQSRPQTPWYVHGALTQGHTELGQFLGAPGGFGGGAAMLAADRYSADGRWTARWGRTLRFQYRGADGMPRPERTDVMQELGVERLQSLKRLDITGGATGVWDLNRNFGHDRFNLNLTLGLQARW